jgi:hypothetical protein
MAKEDKIKNLQAEINKVLAFRDQPLVTRPEWGAINFITAEKDLQRIFSIAQMLEALPLDSLSDNIADKISESLSRAKPYLDSINKFTIEQSNAPQTRNTLVDQVHAATNNILEVVTPWIPFLAYQKGDISENISKLSKAITQANSVLDTTKTDIERKSAEIDSIIVKAREASAGAGAAVFTQDFLKESKDLERQAFPWLKAAAWFGGATVAIAGATWFWTPAGLDYGQIIQKVASKLVALSVLLTATIWCGRLYKALRHQAAVNKHRALSLQTFQAFSVAASDTQTKNAVLLETTRSIFALQDTGLVDSSGSDRESNVIEIAKSVAAHE